MSRAEKILTENDVKFQAGLNEDLAATALWGSQQAELRGVGAGAHELGVQCNIVVGGDRSAKRINI